MSRILGLFLASVCLSSAVSAHADELSDVRQRGTLICATLGTAPPFSFQDAKSRETVGYDVDMCHALADALKVKLELKLVSVDARIPELLQGRVDVVAANLGYTKQRAQQIDFSYGYFAGPSKLLVRKDSGLTTLDQLAGKRIAIVKGSSAEQAIKRLIPSANIVSYPDPTSGFLAVLQGKTDALCASELAVLKMQRQGAASTPLSIIDKPVFVESWGIGLRKGEPAFEKAVNDALAGMETSGRANAIFQTWLGTNSEYKVQRNFRFEPIRD